MKICTYNASYVKIICNPAEKQALYDFYSFQPEGYRFQPKFKYGLWDGFIHLFNRTSNLLPKGLVKSLKTLDFEIVEDLPNPILINSSAYKMPFLLRDYQQKTLEHIYANETALIESPTSSGKSAVIFKAIEGNLDKKILILVPNKSLVAQLYKDFEDYKPGFSSKNVHQIFQGKEKNSDKPIYLSTWQSIYKLDKQYFQQFQLVIVDEVHLADGKSISTILNNCTNAYNRYGFTGTLKDTKAHLYQLKGIFGEIFTATTTVKLIENSYITPFEIKICYLKYPLEVCKQIKGKIYKEELEWTLSSNSRHNFTIDVIKRFKETSLITFGRIEHGKRIHESLLEGGLNSKLIYGQTDLEIREQVRELAETDELVFIVASTQIFSTGINIKNLTNIVLAHPTKSKIRTLQSIGRVLRKREGKQLARVYDIFDDLSYKSHENYLIKHAQERLDIYNSEKFSIKIHSFNLK
jgi:superfamily II DNA or RNA helicase